MSDNSIPYDDNTNEAIVKKVLELIVLDDGTSKNTKDFALYLLANDKYILSMLSVITTFTCTVPTFLETLISIAAEQNDKH